MQSKGLCACVAGHVCCNYASLCCLPACWLAHAPGRRTSLALFVTLNLVTFLSRPAGCPRLLHRHHHRQSSSPSRASSSISTRKTTTTSRMGRSLSFQMQDGVRRSQLTMRHRCAHLASSACHRAGGKTGQQSVSTAGRARSGFEPQALVSLAAGSRRLWVE